MAADTSGGDSGVAFLLGDEPVLTLGGDGLTSGAVARLHELAMQLSEVTEPPPRTPEATAIAADSAPGAEPGPSLEEAAASPHRPASIGPADYGIWYSAPRLTDAQAAAQPMPGEQGMWQLRRGIKRAAQAVSALDHAVTAAHAAAPISGQVRSQLAHMIQHSHWLEDPQSKCILVSDSYISLFGSKTCFSHSTHIDFIV